MSDKIQETPRRNNGSNGHPQGYDPGSQPTESPELQERGDHGSEPGIRLPVGRYYTAAQERGASQDRGFEGWSTDFAERGLERNLGRATPIGDLGDFEHERVGFRDFGTPTFSQGRELRERYDERDFPGRDDRYAGRSGSSFHPERDYETPYNWAAHENLPPRPSPFFRSWHPEEDWERAHSRAQYQQPRPRLWEREPALAHDVMTPNPHAVHRSDSLKTVAAIMREESVGVVPVVDEENRLLGLITDRDIVMRTSGSERPWQQWRADEVMTDDIECVTPEESVHEVIRLMGRRQVRRVPVIDRNDRLLGMISMADIATRADRDEELQHTLDRISRRRSFWSRVWR